MSSSFPKHHCLHRLITFISAFLVAGSFTLLLNKQKKCNYVPIADELWSSMVNNQSLQFDYIEQHYDDVQIYHISLVSLDVIIFMVAFINIAPVQEDLRFGFHLLLIIILSGLTILACYSSYVVFYKPCHLEPPPGIARTEGKQVYLQSSKTNAGKNAPINAYVENDLHILAVVGLDALACFLFLFSTMILCSDAREEAIQDEYVARVRASIY